MALIQIGYILYGYINNISWFFTDTTFYNSKWSSHSQNPFLPTLICSDGSIKIDYSGNYTTKDCWNFETLSGSAYTQCCAKLVDEYPVYNFDEIIDKFVTNTTIFVFALILAQIIDIVMFSIYACSMWNICDLC
jgi:hypothetical protein